MKRSAIMSIHGSECLVEGRGGESLGACLYS